jgi:hypothetical protein
MKKIISSFASVALLYTYYNVSAQQQLRIVPSIGMDFPFSYAIDKSNVDKGYGANGFKLGASFQLDLQYQWNSNWEVFSGIQSGHTTGFQLRYGVPSLDYAKGKYSSAAPTRNIHLGLMRHISTHAWFPIQRRAQILKRTAITTSDELLYAILFRLRVFGGVLHNHVVSSRENNEIGGFGRGTFVYHVDRKESLSVFAGINLQFFNYQKDYFQLSFMYSQGLQQMIHADIDYELPSGKYSTTIGSRGSFFQIQLGYPIRLYQSEGRRKND